MLPIPHGLETALRSEAAPIAALVASVVLALAARWAAWRGAAAALIGWAVLTPVGAWPDALWAPHRGVAVLLAPAAVAVLWLGAFGRTAGSRPRLTAVALAGFAGWWVARHMADEAAFWRVWAAVALLPLALRRAEAGTPGQRLATGAALTGALWVAGAAAPTVLAAGVLAVAAAADLVAGGAPVPAALVAVLFGVAELGGGSLERGRIGAVDLACLAALGAPLLARGVASRVGRGGAGMSAGLCGLAGAALSVVLLWFARRAFLT